MSSDDEIGKEFKYISNIRESDHGTYYINFYLDVLGDYRKAQSKCFIKKVTGINREYKNGYAIEGSFVNIRNQIELKEGDILLVVRGDGSWKYKRSTAYIVQLVGGKLITINKFNYRAEKLNLIEFLDNLFKQKLEENLTEDNIKKLVHNEIKKLENKYNISIKYEIEF